MPSYKQWLDEFYPQLFDLFQIVLEERSKVNKKHISTLTFQQFCELGYISHGTRRRIFKS